MQSRSDEDTAAAESGPSPCQMSTSESNGKNARRLLQSYEPLPYHLIDEEIVILEGVYESMSRLWEEECQKYEETMEVRVDDKKLTVPRRNYLNEKGTVEDDSLFPYHTACYPLLDAYDCIYEEDQSQQPISSKAFRRHPFVTPQERHPEEITDVQGFMPCSVKAIIESLVMDRYFLGGFWRWMDALVRQHKCLCSLGSFPAENTLIEFDALQFSNDAEGWRTFVTERMSLETSAPYGPLHLPRERKDRATILLKLVRHSLSELQRDYRVAAAAMVLLMILHDLEDILVFRQLLVVIESEFVGCGNPCDHEILDMNHFCSDWSQLHLVIKMVICDGVSFFTHEHAICLAGFVRSIYLREFGSLALDPAEESVTGKRKRILKRTVVARRALEDDEDDEGREDSTGKIPAQLVELLVSCLGERGIFERKRLLKLRNDYAKYDVIPKDIICQFVSSYYNCVRVLVSVAELTVQLLPESERFYPIASCLVSSLFRSISLHEVDVGENARYFGLNCPTLRDIRLISPLRYADSITDAMGRKRVRFAGRSAAPLEVDPSTSFLLEKFESQFEQEPPNDVLTAVQGLYLRNLVDVRYAGLGYGDFLMWCRYEITPLDPILFW